MAQTISQRDLRNDSAEVLRRVEAGESLVVTRRGIPVADLVPHHPHSGEQPRRHVAADDILKAFDGLPPWDAAQFEDDQLVLDQRVDDTITDPWERD